MHVDINFEGRADVRTEGWENWQPSNGNMRQSLMNKGLKSIAIAGAWGYIGRKILDASLRLDLRPYVYDPGPFPSDLDPKVVTCVGSEAEFYSLNVDLFHLALHPEARQTAQTMLLQRAQTKPLFILNEKPIVSPDAAGEALPLIQAIIELKPNEDFVRPS